MAAQGNVFPRLLVGLYSKFLKSDINGAVKLQKKVTLAKNLTDFYSIRSLYEILREKGIDHRYPKKPFLRLYEERKREMIQRLKNDNLLRISTYSSRLLGSTFGAERRGLRYLSSAAWAEFCCRSLLDWC